MSRESLSMLHPRLGPAGGTHLGENNQKLAVSAAFVALFTRGAHVEGPEGRSTIQNCLLYDSAAQKKSRRTNWPQV